MRRHWKKLLLFAILLFPLLLVAPGSAGSPSPSEEGSSTTRRLFISGFILGPHKEPVRNASLRIRIDAQQPRVLSRAGKFSEATSSLDGFYVLEVVPPKEFGSGNKVEIEVRKAGFRATRIPLAGEDFAQKGENFFLRKDISVPRTVGPAFWVATVVFLGVYLLICFELLHRTVAAMLGAAALLAVSYTYGSWDPEYRIISFGTAIQKIDMNVVFLLMGMMIIVGILKQTGLFQWSACRFYQAARGNVWALSAMFMGFAAGVSAVLGNVNTMFLLTPVTIAVSQTLRISPLTLLIPGVMAANVGGAATLIGDFPNLMIGSYAGLSFTTFARNLAGVCLVCLLVLWVATRIYYRKTYREASVTEIESTIARLREEFRITDRTLMGYGLGVMGFVGFLLVAHGNWNMEVSVAALAGAAILLTYGVLSRRVKVFDLMEKDIEWPTLLFFMFLFMVVGGVEETGLLSMIGDWAAGLAHGNLTVAVCLVLWVSAFVSAFVDNIPYTAAMLPVTAYLTQTIPGAEGHVLWWALSLGACLGGNGTIIGAWSNIVTMGMAEAAGYPISFARFMKFGMIYMLISVGICNVWLLVFY